MSPVSGVMTIPDSMSSEGIVAHVRRLEALGHRSVWIPDMFGREIYITAGYILANTETITVASAVAHVYGRDPIASAQAGRTLSDLYGGRFIQGLGVSHPIASEMRHVPWENPVTKTRDYVTALRQPTPLFSFDKSAPVPIYIAAHGPKMLGVAAEGADGANSYMQTTEHTTAAGHRAVSIYLPLPAYQRQWAAQGFTEADWSNGGSDRLIDTYIAWGDIDTVFERMNAHIAAGASAIVLAALNPDLSAHDSPWDLVEAVAPGP